MSSELETAGAAITAGMASAAIEARDPRHAAHGPCANCGTTLRGRFCHACGQAGHVHRSLAHVFEELLHGILHFDGRAVRTLPMLAFRPGTLTGDYIFGMRARYISPVALFLFVVFLMFFAFSLTGGIGVSPPAPVTTVALQSNVSAAQAEVSAAQAELAKERETLAILEVATQSAEPGEIDAQRGVVAGAEGELSAAQSELTQAQRELQMRLARIEEFRTARAQLDVDEKTERLKPVSVQRDRELARIARAKTLVDEALASPTGPPQGLQAKISEDGRTKIAVNLSETQGMEAVFEEIRHANSINAINVNTGVPAWDKKIHEKLENPELGWYKIQNAAYKFAFLLAPLSLPFVGFLFLWKRNVTFYDHAVFVLYSLSFACFLAMGVSLLSMAWPTFAGDFALAAVGVLAVHMYFQIKGGYGLSWWSGLWRTLLLLLFCVICLSIFVVMIVLFGLVG